MDVATEGLLGGGDLSILVERAQYRERVQGQTVELWTYDEQLYSRG